MAETSHLLHHTRDGERWDLLAHRYYGDVAMQDSIIAANRDLFLSDLKVPAILRAGLTLRVPIVERDETPQADLLPPWKR